MFLLYFSMFQPSAGITWIRGEENYRHQRWNREVIEINILNYSIVEYDINSKDLIIKIIKQGSARPGREGQTNSRRSFPNVKS